MRESRNDRPARDRTLLQLLRWERLRAQPSGLTAPDRLGVARLEGRGDLRCLLPRDACRPREPQKTGVRHAPTITASARLTQLRHAVRGSGWPVGCAPVAR